MNLLGVIALGLVIVLGVWLGGAGEGAMGSLGLQPVSAVGSEGSA